MRECYISKVLSKQACLIAKIKLEKSVMVCVAVLIQPWRIGQKLTENRVKIHSCSERTPELNEVCSRKVMRVCGQFVLGIGQFFAERASWSEIA